MLNLITDTEQKRLKNEYYIRLAIVVSVMFFVVMTIGALSLVPSYIALKIEHASLQTQRIGLEASIAEQGGDEARDILRSTSQKTAVVAHRAEQQSIANLISSIIEVQHADIQIHSFSYAEGSAETSNITLKGNAETRTGLVTFSDKLKADDRFTNVSLPLKDLASNQDISFTVSIEMKK